MKLIFKTPILLLFLAASIVFGLSGCNDTTKTDEGGQVYLRDENLNEGGILPICKETVTLKLLRAQYANIEDIKTNKYTKKLEKDANVKLEFELAPGNDITTKINLLMNSGTGLPDVINYPLTQSQVMAFSKTGMIIPLNDYYKNSSYYLKKGLERIPEKNILQYITYPDRNIYSIPSYAESLPNEFPNIIWIYKPWLDKLGLSVPKTPEELKYVLVAFRDNDMNGNGNKNDEIPLLDFKSFFTTNCIMNAYVSFDTKDSNKWLTVNNGKLSFAFMQEEWKQGIIYLNDLCTNNLLTPVSFTMDEASYKTVLADEINRVGAFGWTSTSCLPATSPRRSEFVPVLLENNGKKGIWYSKTMPTEYWFITKECKNPEAAFRLGDYMCSDEMTIWSRWGEKGVDWVEPPAGTKGQYEQLGYTAKIQPVLAWGSIQNSHWLNTTPCFRTYDVAASESAIGNAYTLAKANAIVEWIKYIPEETLGTLIFTEDELAEFSEIMLVANNFVEEKITRFITGGQDVENSWDGYLQNLENMSISKALDIAQKAYNRMTNN